MARALDKVDNISFVVETLFVRDRRKLGIARPDGDGYYDMPLAVLGTETRNGTYYEVSDFVDQITGAESYVNKLVTDGNLYGEYGHPAVALLNHDQQISRLLTIDEKSVSHHIRQIATGETLESGGKIIIGKVKPFGPYGGSLQENLDNPNMNTAFSLRSIAISRDDGRLIRRNIKKLVTFDAVAVGGYAEASKRYSPSTESLSISMTPSSNVIKISEAAMECFTNTEINEIFGSREVMIGKQRLTYLDRTKTFIDNSGRHTSVYQALVAKHRK